MGFCDKHPEKTSNTQPPKASLKTLDPKILLQLAQQFTQHNPPTTPRERKPQYPEALLLALALTMTANPYSFRALRYWAEVFFPDVPLPSLSTLWYRVVSIPEARWHAFLTWLAEQGIAQERVPRAGAVSERPPLVLVDGTEVG